jgi:hypothetical protein
MNIQRVFNHLFEVAKKSKDPEGVVVACLVKGDTILISSPSASDGVRHAEDLVLELAANNHTAYLLESASSHTASSEVFAGSRINDISISLIQLLLLTSAIFQ